MRKILFIVMIICTSSLKYIFAAGGIMSGEGSAILPYIVEDYQDLKAIGSGSYTLDKVYSLNSNIDASASATENDGAGFITIGNSTTPFIGTFLGNDYTISSLTINRPGEDCIGLFGALQGSSILISNLGLTDVNITGNNAVGGLVGGINAGCIMDCYCSGQVTGAGYTGGLLGGIYSSGGAVINCYTTSMTVNGVQYTGGLIGANSGGNIENCYTTSSVTVIGSSSYTGGIVGTHYSTGLITGSNSAATVSGADATGGLVGETNGTITYSDNSGNVSGSGGKVGGLAGDNFISGGPGIINNCFNTGGVTATASDSYAGGIAGKNTGIITDCYNTADISGNKYVGGLIGYIYSGATVSNSHSTGNISGTGDIGGFAGDNYGTIINCYCETGTVTATGNSIGGFVGCNKNMVSGSHSTCNVTGVNNVGGFCGYMGNTTGSLLSCFATGDVNGAGYVGGLVGYNNKNTLGIISESYSTGIVTGTGNYVGGLIGYNYGSNVSNSYYTGNVTGVSYVGGLIGYNTLQGTDKSISNCTTSGTVSGSSEFSGGLIGRNNLITVTSCSTNTTVNGSLYSGGLVGCNNATSIINNSHTTGPVTSTSGFTGGLVGFNLGTITSCTSSGAVSGGKVPAVAKYITRTCDKDYSCAGGLVGYNEGIISNSSTTNTVTSNGRLVGGVFGWNYNGTVSRCAHTTGAITISSDVSAGGVGGGNYNGTIEYCFNTATVKGTAWVGGILGDNTQNGILRYCYNRGDIDNFISGYYYFGGIAGLNISGSTILQCYSTGSLLNVLDCNMVGGIAGQNLASFSGCFFDITTAGISTAIAEGTISGVTGLSTTDMISNTYFLSEGWDDDTWFMDTDFNDGYPYLSWQKTDGSPLPVELTFFKAVAIDNGVELKWTTATEVNNYGFQVERKKEKVQSNEWDVIGFVEGNGNSNSPKEYSFVDSNPLSGNLQYRLKQIDTDGTFKYYSDIAEVNYNLTNVIEKQLPTEFGLSQNFPNPFNPETVISYKISVSCHVTLKVYDVLGNEVAALVDEVKTPGYYQVKFDGSSLASGVYIYRLNAESFTSTKKLIVMK